MRADQKFDGRNFRNHVVAVSPKERERQKEREREIEREIKRSYL